MTEARIVKIYYASSVRYAFFAYGVCSKNTNFFQEILWRIASSSRRIRRKMRTVLLRAFSKQNICISYLHHEQ